jgi:hypothetical protein
VSHVGLPGSMRSGRTASLIRHTASRDSPRRRRSRRTAARCPSGSPAAARTRRTPRQAVGALRRLAPQPFVAGLPADPELGAKLAHRCLVLARRNNKSHPLVHRAGLPPRHQRGPSRRAIDLPTIYPVQSVGDLIGSKTPCGSLTPAPLLLEEGFQRLPDPRSGQGSPRAPRPPARRKCRARSSGR